MEEKMILNKRASNKLLIKNEVGKPKQSTYTLPPINHSYGRSPKKDPESAKESISREYKDKSVIGILWIVTMTWKYHDETKDKEASRDFMKLNRDCLKDHYFCPKVIITKEQCMHNYYFLSRTFKSIACSILMCSRKSRRENKV